VIAKHHGNVLHDTAYERRYVNFAVFIRFHNSRDAKLCGGNNRLQHAPCESALFSNRPVRDRFASSVEAADASLGEEVAGIAIDAIESGGAGAGMGERLEKSQTPPTRKLSYKRRKSNFASTKRVCAR